MLVPRAANSEAHVHLAVYESISARVLTRVEIDNTVESRERVDVQIAVEFQHARQAILGLLLPFLKSPRVPRDPFDSRMILDVDCTSGTQHVEPDLLPKLIRKVKETRAFGFPCRKIHHSDLASNIVAFWLR